MKNLIFNININAPKQKVWDTMLNAKTYKEWVNGAWPGATYIGQWGPRANISFINPDGAGTLAKILAFEPYNTIAAEHIAVLLPSEGVPGTGGVEDRDSETAKNWVGSTEEYHFSESDGVTTLSVSMGVNPEWEPMFNHDWPIALEALKALCEKV
jgi:uncharacterized protein YndB with AHSA1/START domain